MLGANSLAGATMPRPLFVASLAILAAGCLAPVDDIVTAPADCPVLDSRDWSAFVNAMPGPDARPELIVSGTVQLPTAGYSVDLRPGPTEGASPPVQTVELVATPPDGPAATALTDMDVRLEMPAHSAPAGAPSPYRGVRVMCGGSELAFIAPVETAW
jgi:hypothetical protein